jgi:hypothetical protein
MCHQKLQQKLQKISPAMRQGLALYIQSVKGKKAEDRWRLAQALFAQGDPESQPTAIWQRCQAKAAYNAKAFAAAVEDMENTLEAFLKPLSELPIYARLGSIPTSQQGLCLAYLRDSGTTDKGAIIALFQALWQCMNASAAVTRFDVWHFAYPLQSFDPKALSTRLTSLGNLLDALYAPLAETKFCRYLLKLDEKERKEFAGYVALFAEKHLAKLLQLILTHLQKDPQILRRDFVGRWKPGKVNVDSEFNRRTNSLTALLRGFVAMKELLRNPREESAYLMRALVRRGWGSSIFDAEHKDAVAKLNEAQWDSRSYAIALDIEEARLSEGVSTARTPRGGLSFEYAMTLTTQDYLLKTLRFASAAQTRDNVVGTQHDLGALPFILKSIGREGYEMPDLIRIHLLIYDMLSGHDSSRNFKKLLSFLHRHVHTLDQDLLRDGLAFCTNYCSKQMRQGNAVFERILVRIYRKTLALNIYVNNAYIDAGELKNMVMLFARVGLIALAEETLQKYKPLLSPDADPATVNIMDAIILFYQGRFEDAFLLFTACVGDSEDIHFHTDARLLAFACTWELRQFKPESRNATESPFQIQANRIRTYRRRVQVNNQFSRGLDRFYDIMQEFFSIETRSKSDKEKRSKWQSLHAELMHERDARLLYYLRSNAIEAIARLSP